MILVQLTDLHIRPLGMAAHRTAETNMLTERALRSVARLRTRPDAVLLTGDLTDNGDESEYALLAEMLQRYINVPIYAIPGNHDARATMRAGLSHLPGVNDHADFIHYAVETLPVRLVMLDTLNPGSGAGELCAARLDWLDRTLAAAPERQTIVAMHHPPFATGIGHMDAIGLNDREAFAAVIARHKQVERILCGHVHRPITGRVAHAIASVSPSAAHQIEFALGDEAGAWNLEPAAFQVHVLASGGLVSHTVYVENFPGPYPFTDS
jgi:3',5'-cyclic-AMP phosphodiesterase